MCGYTTSITLYNNTICVHTTSHGKFLLHICLGNNWMLFTFSFLEKFILPSDIPVTLPGHQGVATVNGDTDVMLPLVGGEGMACIMACVQIPI